MDARQLKRLAFNATGLIVAAALAIVLSGRYGPTAYALAGLAALVWALGWMLGGRAVCRRTGDGTSRKADRTAVIWTA